MDDLFNLDIIVEPISPGVAQRENTYTTACNCTSTTSCIDDERAPRAKPESACPD